MVIKMNELMSLPYYGGKSAGGGRGIGKWIVSLLPKDTNTLYCEPFAGMLGVLLQRPISKLEIVNDVNSRLINWWRTIRDCPDDFKHLVKYTPRSREEYAWATENIDTHESSLYRALAYHILIEQGIMHSDVVNSNGSWRIAYNTSVGSNKSWDENRIALLSDRLKHVQIECRDVNRVLERIASEEKTVVYADPPYRTADTTAYKHRDIDIEELTKNLLAQKGSVAISGYNDEWEHLGWYRNEFSTRTSIVKGHGENISSPRTEVLWTNYKIQNRLF